jgi:pyruvate dehydrogenase E2 component (dihydrolipoamide acetyltransferase)
MQKGNLVKWCKNIGEEVRIGDIIAEIDTDKATMEVESLYDGVLAKILIPEGTHNVLVRAKIAIIRQEGDTDETIEEVTASASETTAEKPQTKVSALPEKKEEKVISSSIKASPLAKRIAQEYGIDISTIGKGSGPGGRIVKSDIPTSSLSFQEAFVDKNPTSFRMAMIDKLVKSSREVPHFYMQMTADVTDLIHILRSMNGSNIIDIKITVNEFVIKAVALAMRNHLAVNVSWIDGKIRQYRDIDVSVAIAIEEGIYAPVIRRADLKSVKEIAEEIRRLAEKAKQKRLRVDEMDGGSVTVSNLGMCEIDCFYSIINSPQASIISVARAVRSPVIAEDDSIKVGYSLTLGYAVDHRAIDGLTAGRFLANLKQLLENPVVMLL